MSENFASSIIELFEKYCQALFIFSKNNEWQYQFCVMNVSYSFQSKKLRRVIENMMK